MLLRAAHAEGVKFSTFQDEFDLDKDQTRPPRNNFQSVANEIQKRYPQILFATRCFERGRGVDKLKFIEQRIANEQPILVSLALWPTGGWHIMPVVDATDSELTLLDSVHPDSKEPALMRLPKSELVHRHDFYPGGEEVAFLERC